MISWGPALDPNSPRPSDQPAAPNPPADYGPPPSGYAPGQFNPALVQAIDMLRQITQHPSGIDMLTQMGAYFFQPLFRMPLFSALDRFVAKAHHKLPISNFSVGTSSVQLCERNQERIQLMIANLGSAVVYISSEQRVATGASAGDPAGGFPLLAQTSIILDRVATEVWAISSAAGQDVRVLDLAG